MFRKEALPELPTEPDEPPAPPSPPPPSPPRAPSPTAIIRPPAPAYIRKGPHVRRGTSIAAPDSQSVAAPDSHEYASIIPQQTVDDRQYQQDLRQALLANRHLAEGFQPIDAADLPPLDLGGMVASSPPPPSPPPAENPAAPAQAPPAVANPIADVQVSQLEAWLEKHKNQI